MSIFHKFSSKKNAKEVIGESSANDLNMPRMMEVRSCEWPHNAFMDEVGCHQEFAQFVANAGLTDSLADECDQHHRLTISFVHIFYFLNRNNPLRCGLIYILEPVRYRSLNFVRYG